MARRPLALAVAGLQVGNGEEGAQGVAQVVHVADGPGEGGSRQRGAETGAAAQTSPTTAVPEDAQGLDADIRDTQVVEAGVDGRRVLVGDSTAAQAELARHWTGHESLAGRGHFPSLAGVVWKAGRDEEQACQQHCHGRAAR